jgi:OOP family OmpA-OmpF porin
MLNRLAFGLAIACAAFAAHSQTSQAIPDLKLKHGSGAYAQDGRGNVMRNPYGLCWRSGYWDGNNSAIGCDGPLVPPVAKATAPAVVAPSAAAIPAGIAAPRRCDFSASLESNQSFPFNGTILTSAAKKRIDNEVFDKLALCAKVDSIVVTGHSDRIGSQQYNRMLSEKRAQAVVGYLKQKGISARFDSEGAGNAHPVKACDDKLGHRALIECLAPNRRVVIRAKGIAGQFAALL